MDKAPGRGVKGRSPLKAKTFLAFKLLVETTNLSVFNI